MTLLRRGLALLALCGASVLPAEIRIVGSDLLAPVLAPALADWARAEEQAVGTDFAGSHAGWRELQAGRADLAMVSFAPGEAPPDATFVTLPFAWHVAGVLVSANLPLEQVPLSKLAGVFGAVEGGGWKRWADLGVSGEMGTRNILPRVHQPAGCLGPELFRHRVLQGRPWRADLPIRTDAKRPELETAAVAESMVLAPLPWPESAGFKALALARDANEPAYPPTAYHVQRGNYPLAWPVHVVFRREQTRELYPLLRYLLGEEIARLCGQMHLLPAPEAVRSEAVFGLEHL